eukprot:CAMPEP_0173218964 /NCGR_PEP_ID=MMETSP1142-20121109/1348_1 /TAXON_ID=483371 /ORGANISM="non described non described, Strain CCMP2298" /LENGTH=78 /DNA_ID=CAMNT_0014146723 /DNA_START=266 /DNA_END=500 /DNA_ORIENTATION=-
MKCGIVLWGIVLGNWGIVLLGIDLIVLPLVVPLVVPLVPPGPCGLKRGVEDGGEVVGSAGPPALYGAQGRDDERELLS